MTFVNIIIMVELENFHCVSLYFSQSRSEPNLGDFLCFQVKGFVLYPSEEVNDKFWNKILAFKNMELFI